MEHERVPAFAMDRVFRFVDERFLASETHHVTRFEEEHETYAVPTSPLLSPPIVPPRKRTEPRTWAHADAQRFLGNGNNGNNGNNGRPSVKDLAMEFQRRQTDAL